MKRTLCTAALLAFVFGPTCAMAVPNDLPAFITAVHGHSHHTCTAVERDATNAFLYCELGKANAPDRSFQYRTYVVPTAWVAAHFDDISSNNRKVWITGAEDLQGRDIPSRF